MIKLLDQKAIDTDILSKSRGIKICNSSISMEFHAMLCILNFLFLKETNRSLWSTLHDLEVNMCINLKGTFSKLYLIVIAMGFFVDYEILYFDPY